MLHNAEFRSNEPAGFGQHAFYHLLHPLFSIDLVMSGKHAKLNLIYLRSFHFIVSPKGPEHTKRTFTSQFREIKGQITINGKEGQLLPHEPGVRYDIGKQVFLDRASGNKSDTRGFRCHLSAIKENARRQTLRDTARLRHLQKILNRASGRTLLASL